MKATPQYCLSVGNAFDGLTLVGPFDDSESAMEWADQYAGDQEWHLIELKDPEAAAGEDAKDCPGDAK